MCNQRLLFVCQTVVGISRCCNCFLAVLRYRSDRCDQFIHPCCQFHIIFCKVIFLFQACPLGFRIQKDLIGTYQCFLFIRQTVVGISRDLDGDFHIRGIDDFSDIHDITVYLCSRSHIDLFVILPCIRDLIDLCPCLISVPFHLFDRICQKDVFLRIGDQCLDLALFFLPVDTEIHIIFQNRDRLIFCFL